MKLPILSSNRVTLSSQQAQSNLKVAQQRSGVNFQVEDLVKAGAFAAVKLSTELEEKLMKGLDTFSKLGDQFSGEVNTGENYLAIECKSPKLEVPYHDKVNKLLLPYLDGIIPATTEHNGLKSTIYTVYVRPETRPEELDKEVRDVEVGILLFENARKAI